MTIKIIIFRIISSLFILATLVASSFFVNEARKEILCLCGNFQRGVSKADVIRQLKTGKFLHFVEDRDVESSIILVSSQFTLNLVSCEVHFNAKDIVKYSNRSHND